MTQVVEFPPIVLRSKDCCQVCLRTPCNSKNPIEPYRIGPLILMIFFGALLFGFGYVYLFIPETKGLTLEEVDELYRSGVKPWNSPSWKPHLSEEAHEKALEKLGRQEEKEHEGKEI